MTSFTDLTRQVHLLDDLILSDMKCGRKDSYSEEEIMFTKHLLSSKFWFGRISAANKKRFIISLLKSINSVWTLSLILKAIWKCRTKDTVMSANEPTVWTSYDQIPMDHNRTAQPLETLAEVMVNERKWFLCLDPEPQALVICELLVLSGGPLLREIFCYAQHIYDRHIEDQLQSLQDCVVVNEPTVDKTKTPEQNLLDNVVNYSAEDNEVSSSGSKSCRNMILIFPKNMILTWSKKSGKKEPTPRRKTSLSKGSDIINMARHPTNPFKELEANLAIWAATMKTMRNNMKLEELEITFKDGTQRKVWKVNRSKPEATETVDFIQLLPSTISKRIFLYLPPNQLSEYSKVNKYWAFLIDELRAEIVTRQKLNTEIEKMRENILRHDLGIDLMNKTEFTTAISSGTSIMKTSKKDPTASALMSVKSAGTSYKQMFNKDAKRPVKKPIQNMKDMYERLDRRGAADENIWKWCSNVLKLYKQTVKTGEIHKHAGVIQLGNIHFPCPMMAHMLNLPLNPPITKDPSTQQIKKQLTNVTNTTQNDERCNKKCRYNLRTKDFSSLYPITKIPSYQII